jgi:hypothetical protein
MAKKVRKPKAKKAKLRAAVKTGARGGKYRVVSGKKVYVKSRAKQTTRRVKAKVTRVRRARKPRAAPIAAGPDILPMPAAATTRVERADKPVKARSGDRYDFYALHLASGEFETVPFASKRLDAIFLGGGGQGYSDFLDAFRSPGGSSSDIVRDVMRATYKAVVKRYPRFKDADAYDSAGMRLSKMFARKLRVDNSMGWDSTDLEDFQNA